MGQKVNPHGYRVGINKTWDSNWITDKKHIATYILEETKFVNLLKINTKIAILQKFVLKETTIQQF